MDLDAEVDEKIILICKDAIERLGDVFTQYEQDHNLEALDNTLKFKVELKKMYIAKLVLGCLIFVSNDDPKEVNYYLNYTKDTYNGSLKRMKGVSATTE